MIREVLTDMTMIDVHRYLRRIKARLIRMIPKQIEPGKESYVVFYVKEEGA